ncbi:sugar ABC transporter ATP-binding protein [Defluviimonas sp. WL0075]|uniref:Sugar ABC transporter ATP-binding protein n=1 Tax=Albidovulum sediminicola TaxID=2984331 RepID=A0ABT2Z6P9_9RHOB|nr:sugar ABC transporter ATP-binding protein [Defluviimonas sp. WL0075]MCV2866813.1 sugar ABC transporter ATP-binding protein [Defluviimonas sp. WL0075]
MTTSHILEMSDIAKSFGKIPVLKRVSFNLRRGEIHALMGGNGAGKSTLMKILTGVYNRDGGSVRIEGAEVELHDTAAAERAGVAMIFQEFSLIPTLTVAQNIFLKHEPRLPGTPFINNAEMVRRSRDLLHKLGVDIDPEAPVGSLSVGYMQIVEIAKALSKQARILVMDEPTSSLSEAETEALFALVRRLRDDGLSVVYISHRMAEILELCDRVTVMRDGQTVLTEDCAAMSVEHIVDAMLGAGNTASFTWHDRGELPDAEPILRVRNLKLDTRIQDVSFDIRPGEIVGLAGLMGSGRSEIAETIFGRQSPVSGTIEFDGKPLRGQADAIARGVALVPEDRRKMGLVLDHSVRDNIVLPNLDRFSRHLFMRDGAAMTTVNATIRDLGIKTDGPEKLARLLSGGNQQKIVIGKWLARNPRLLILDEPTIGVDVGAKSEIVETVRAMADRGMAVLVISSELEEIMAISDRILVLHGGRIVQQMNRRDVATEEELHHAIQGHRIHASDARHA